jgi:hypothetical protein
MQTTVKKIFWASEANVKIQYVPIFDCDSYQPSYTLILSISDAFPPDSSRSRDGDLCAHPLGAAGCTVHLQLHVLMQVW